MSFPEDSYWRYFFSFLCCFTALLPSFLNFPLKKTYYLICIILTFNF